MSRGSGKRANEAIKSGKLSAFVVPKSGSADTPYEREWVDWGEVNPNLVVGAVVSVVREGGALLYGCSRDNTSYSVKIYYGGDSNAYYFPCSASGVEAVETFLAGVIEATA